MSGLRLCVLLACLLPAGACTRSTAGLSAPTVPATWVEPVTGMAFVYIPPGRFVMGSPSGETGRQDDEVEHDVEISRGFYLGRYEVTREEWSRLQDVDPSQHTTCGPRCPVETVSHADVQRYLLRLNEVAGDAGRFRLPTEAEWEYACRAGTRTPFSSSAMLTSERANIDDRAADQRRRVVGAPAPVGSYPPNPWGLHDMHGNVWEWTEDWYAAYRAEPARDPLAGRQSAAPVWDARGGDLVFKRVIRGGSWHFDANSTRCALRYTHASSDSGFSLGFRVLREIP